MRATALIVTLLPLAFALPDSNPEKNLAQEDTPNDLPALIEEQNKLREDGLNSCVEKRDGWRCVLPNYEYSVHGMFPSIDACIEKCEDKESKHREHERKQREQAKLRDQGHLHCTSFGDKKWHCVYPSSIALHGNYDTIDQCIEKCGDDDYKELIEKQAYRRKYGMHHCQQRSDGWHCVDGRNELAGHLPYHGLASCAYECERTLD
ncbi:hypothetical protein CP532_6788 [Ophiocordyceps camponoti-leonardi (nom. inval.)]|nr:hypothetical protein CP532_6788 [Ophiocordyceps camponoti-leonardi (nom. inval.)]